MTRQIEKRLQNEYMNEFYSDKHYETRVWIGPTPPGPESRMYEVINRWADAIVFEPGLISIIEFKLEPDPKAIGQLDMYEQLFPTTLRFREYWDRTIKKIFVTTRVDDHVKGLADSHNIEYRVFHPDWVKFWEKRRFKL